MAENAGAPPRLRAWPPHGSGTDPAERPPIGSMEEFIDTGTRSTNNGALEGCGGLQSDSTDAHSPAISI